MRTTNWITTLVIIFYSLFYTSIVAQGIATLIPTNTATHTATKSGSWFDPNIWQPQEVPGNASIVVIPSGITVQYEGQSDAHIFAVRVDGEFICKQSNTANITKIAFDTFVGTHMSKVKFLANGEADGVIEVNITPFDIQVHKGVTPMYSQVWNSAAMTYYSDGNTTEMVVTKVGPDKRFDSYEEALAGNTSVIELSRTPIDDGPGVLGRYTWDPTQLSLGVVVMGEVEILGQEKTNMIKLAADASNGQPLLQLVQEPMGWKVGDTLIVTRGGNMNTTNNGEDEAVIQSINGNSITCVTNLKKKHEGRPTDNLHCYVGNLTRNINFRATSPDNVHHRGHFMAMHNDTNIQIKNAAFVDMGRTDKSRLTDDFVWEKWLEPKVFNSKISALGQECVGMKRNEANEITNSRGRYSIHLHKTGAQYGANMAQVTGNVVWGNPGWGITQHDSHANVSQNVVYEVTGAGIVSETGSETGFWDNNLVVKILTGHNESPYTAALFHDDYLYSGQGLGMKGRAIMCRGNVIANANMGVGIINMNPSVTNHDRVDPLALATVRPGYEVDQFPLSTNGYSIEGDGVMPVEVALIMENTTIIWCYQGLRSIERDMGVNHESRSVFDGFKAWGINQGLSIVYQADYSFKDVFVSGKNMNALGVFLWKHSHNHVFDGIKMVDLGHGITVSKLVESGNGELKTRNNGFTPWYFIDLITENVTELYEIVKENTSTATPYIEHTDNPIHLSSSDITNRPTTFTILDATQLSVNYGTGDLRFEVDGIITDDLGSYDMGIKQAASQGTLRLDYPQRIYEFASKAKFEEYLSQHGVYKDEANEDQLYFIINESLPNRATYQYTSFPVRVKIENAPTSGIFATPQVESEANFLPKNQIVSRLATVSQSSTNTNASYEELPIDAGAHKAVDGNTNGRINAQFFQRGLLPLGSFSETNIENEPWYDLDLGEQKIIDFIDIWNTVELNGTAIETLSPHFKNFYVLISDAPFSGMNLATARSIAQYEYQMGATPKRKFSLNNINATGRYVRIQAVGNTLMKFAEVEIIGRAYIEENTLNIKETTIPEIHVYPNPTQGELFVDLGKTYEELSIKIHSILGQQIFAATYRHQNAININVIGQTGVYFMEIESQQGLYKMYEIVKQ